MSNKVAILHQGFIPQYRVRFYELLTSTTSTHYVVFHGSASSNEGHRPFHGAPSFPNVSVNNYEFRFLKFSIIYQPLVSKIMFGSFDAVILGHELKYISNLLLFFLCKATGKTVLWWGHGFHIDRRLFSPSGYIAPAVGGIKNFLARSADMYLVYTEGGAKKLLQSGMRKGKIAPIRNTIDMTELICLYEKYRHADVERIRQQFNLRPDSVILLYVGRLIKEKRVEELLSLVKLINSANLCRKSVEAVVIGVGPELHRLRNVATEIGDAHILGQIDDEDVVARYMRVSSAFVIPGKVGLAVNYAFAHGVPVITRQQSYQSPEVEYIVSGENGLIVNGDFNDFVRSVAAYVESVETQETLAMGALKTRDTLSLHAMVKAFDSATCNAIGRKRRLTVGEASKERIKKRQSASRNTR